jgi:hypothetical protein
METGGLMKHTLRQRQLAKNPGFTLAARATLALEIGVSAAAFDSLRTE